MRFGENLKRLMAEEGVTQTSLAAVIGVSQRAVSKWINLQAEPTERSIVNCARFFGVSADYILGMEDEDGTERPHN